MRILIVVAVAAAFSAAVMIVVNGCGAVPTRIGPPRNPSAKSNCQGSPLPECESYYNAQEH
jgi:hypothetical protein